VAGSVWGGGGKDGYLRSWRSTANGLESTALRHNDGVLCLDELQQVDPKEASQLAYTLANGFAKSRATRSGGARRTEEWRELFLSSGEISLADHLRGSGQKTRGGQEIRMCDIPADAGKNKGLFDRVPEGIAPAAFAIELKKAATSNYGSPIPEADYWKREVHTCRTEFEKRLWKQDHSAEVSRVLSRFSLLAAAGTIATRMGITGWKEDEAQLSVAACFKAWLKSRGTSGSWDMDQAIAQIRSLLLSSPHRLRNLKKTSAADEETQYGSEMVKGAQQIGYMFHGADGRIEEYWLFQDEFKRVACEGYDPQAVLGELQRRKFLRMGERDRKTVKIKSPEHGRIQVYAIRSTIVSEENSGDA